MNPRDEQYIKNLSGARRVEYSNEYKPGDTLSMVYSGGGFVTGSRGRVDWSTPIPKSMKNVNPKLTSLIVNFRKSDGGYAPVSSWDALANADVINISKATDYLIDFDVRYSADLFGFTTNNTPVGIYAAFTIEFEHNDE